MSTGGGGGGGGCCCHLNRRRPRRLLLTVLFLLLYLAADEAEADEAKAASNKGISSDWLSRLALMSRRFFDGDSRRDFLRVCYGHYGCFSIDTPWFSSHRVINAIPKSPSAIRPHFMHYSRAHAHAHHPIVEGDVAKLRRSDFDSEKMTFVITHGYLEHGSKDWLQQMKDELLVHGDYNVIIVDWLAGSRPPYTQAVANIRLIGAMTAHLLAFLAQAAGLDLMRVHLVGHSLGAHLCGYVGNYLQRAWSLTAGRITGLDPAEPHFEWADPVTRLDASDAYFVDVIHTDAAPILSFGLGMFQPCGHLDFYPNGGRVMAGCEDGVMGSLEQEKGNMAYALRRFLGCNHFRAYEYFIESINSDCPFLAVKCSSYQAFVNGQCNGCLADGDPTGCEFMGFKAFATLDGQRPTFEHRELYLLTEDERPFCSAPYRVTIVLSDTRESISQGGDRGNFYMILHGEDNSTSSPRLLLNKQEAFFEAGRAYDFMIATRGLDHVHSAEVTWEYSYHLLNPLTWRMFSNSRIFVNRIEIEQFGGGHKHTFCAQDRPLYPGKAQHVAWRPHCRENAPDPGATFLGTVLNADPWGNAQYIFHQLNPLAMNPLNGLANLGMAFRGFSDGVNRMSATIRRTGSEVRRRVGM